MGAPRVMEEGGVGVTKVAGDADAEASNLLCCR